MKKYTACFLIGGTVLSLMACAKKDLTTNPSTMENQMMSESGTSQVTATDLPIEDILNQARKAIGNGTVTAIEYEKGNPNYYEVDIYVGDLKYELQIDALTGDLFNQEQTSVNAYILDGVNISIDEAISIATSQSNGGVVHSIQLEPKEIGVVYEAEAIKNNKKQEIEISATDGKIISFEEEIND